MPEPLEGSAFFSFNGNKIVTGSTGGMVLCSTDEEKDRFVHLATQAKIGDPYVYLHRETGYNYRMSNLVAAILCAQIENLDDKIRMKRKIYTMYESSLNGLYGCVMLPVPNDRVSNYWLSCLVTEDNTGELVENLVLQLDKQQIQTRRVWTPLHIQPVFNGCDFITAQKDTPNSIDFFKRAICIPSDTNMTTTDQIRVIKEICGVVNEFYWGKRNAGK